MLGKKLNNLKDRIYNDEWKFYVQTKTKYTYLLLYYYILNIKQPSPWNICMNMYFEKCIWLKLTKPTEVREIIHVFIHCIHAYQYNKKNTCTYIYTYTKNPLYHVWNI